MGPEEYNKTRKADEAIQESGSQPKKSKGNDCVSGVRSGPIVIKSSTTQVSVTEEDNPPEEFRCPVTLKIMSDPVKLSNGLILERKPAELWFHDNPYKCPRTLETLISEVLTPDVDLRIRINQWNETKKNNEESKEYFRMLLWRLSFSYEDQLASATELRKLVSASPPLYAASFAVMGPSALLEVVRPLLVVQPPSNESLQEDLIVTITLLAEQNATIQSFFAHHPHVVNIVAESLRSGTPTTRLHALSLVHHIAAVPASKDILINAGFVEHLVETVEEGNLLLLNHALRALHKLSLFISQRVINSIVTAIVDHLEDERSITNLIQPMHLLLKEQMVWENRVATEMVCSRLLDVVRESQSYAVTEFCVASLLQIIKINRPVLLETCECEEEFHAITRVRKRGTAKAKKAAEEILILIHERYLHQSDTGEVEHHKILNTLQQAETDDVMNSSLDSLLAIIEREEADGDAAQIATWKREELFNVISRPVQTGSEKVKEVAEKIMDWLIFVEEDQLWPDLPRN